MEKLHDVEFARAEAAGFGGGQTAQDRRRMVDEETPPGIR